MPPEEDLNAAEEPNCLHCRDALIRDGDGMVIPCVCMRPKTLNRTVGAGRPKPEISSSNPPPAAAAPVIPSTFYDEIGRTYNISPYGIDGSSPVLSASQQPTYNIPQPHPYVAAPGNAPMAFDPNTVVQNYIPQYNLGNQPMDGAAYVPIYDVNAQIPAPLMDQQFMQQQLLLPDGSPAQFMQQQWLMPDGTPAQFMQQQWLMPDGSPAQFMQQQWLMPDGSPAQFMQQQWLMPDGSPAHLIDPQLVMPNGEPAYFMQHQGPVENAAPAHLFEPQVNPLNYFANPQMPYGNTVPMMYANNPVYDQGQMPYNYAPINPIYYSNLYNPQDYYQHNTFHNTSTRYGNAPMVYNAQANYAMPYYGPYEPVFIDEPSMEDNKESTIDPINDATDGNDLEKPHIESDAGIATPAEEENACGEVPSDAPAAGNDPNAQNPPTGEETKTRSRKQRTPRRCVRKDNIPVEN